MRAATFIGAGEPLEIREVALPDVPADGVRVETLAAGVCRSDIHNWLGDWHWLGFENPVPRILGHEMAGVVVETGPLVRRINVGDRVTIPFHVACGVCARCRSSETNLCSRALYLGGSLPGAFAEYVAIPRADLNCVRLPDEVSIEAGAALGCRFMTAWHGLNDLARVQPGEWVVVIGAGGGVGLSAVSLSQALGARVIAVDRSDEKLAAAQRAGAERVIKAVDDPFEEQVLELTRGGADVSLDAVAKQSTVRSALLALRAGGRHVQVGMTDASEQGDITIPIDRVVAGELKLLGVSGNPHANYAPLLELVRSGRCDPAALIGSRIALDDINDAFAKVRDYEAKGVVMVTQFNRQS
jgi:D-arabinose 1-dehydrogenase-like Zn-dependent alcohol dehydrogenase